MEEEWTGVDLRKTKFDICYSSCGARKKWKTC